LAGWLYFAKALDGVTAFWIAFIVTRPIGASLGDLMIQIPKDGGVGIGISTVNIVFFTVILGLIAYLTKTRLDVQEVEVKDIVEEFLSNKRSAS